MKIKKQLISVLALASLFCVTCTNEKKANVRNEISTKKLSINNISIDTIKIKIPNTSSIGKIKFLKDSIAFTDEIFCQISTYNMDGTFRNMFLGKGMGPKEVSGLQEVIITPQNKYVFENWNVHTYNRNWEKTHVSRINWDSKKSIKYLTNNPSADERGIYEVKYFQNTFILADDNNFFFNIESTHPKYNGYFKNTAKEYYQTAHLVGKMDTKTLKVSSLLGNYSSAYISKIALPNLANWNYDLVGDSIYLTFDIDDKVYVMDKNFQTKRTFGIRPEIMGSNYIAVNNPDEASDRFEDDRSKVSFFSGIKYIKEKDILFRTYTTGKPVAATNTKEFLQEQRMQIYKGNVLIGDVTVPAKFKIIGYDKEYFYADGFYNENEIGFYRFKIQ